jgi:hypothetical protein
LYDANKALGIAATWIFPLALFLSLPFDSPIRKRFRVTMEAVLNWLGSPQTALIATLFNFRQTKRCHDRRKRQPDIWIIRDVYFVLSCLNQFELSPAHAPNMVRCVIYGLFRPTKETRSDSAEFFYLQDLLHDLAHQCRMLRRRGVVPVILSLGTFLAAFVFSIVLAFGEVGTNSTAHSLALGILFGWLPILVCYAILDRNPVSSDRSSELFNRWLFNVRAVRDWVDSDGADDPVWWNPGNIGNDHMGVGDYVGQGRRTGYNGLAWAVLAEHGNFERTLRVNPANYDNYAQAVQTAMATRPISWYLIALTGLCVIWWQVLSAFVISYFTPTIGLGCRALSFLLYGGISSVPWLMAMFPVDWSENEGAKKVWVAIALFFKTVAVLGGLAIIGFQLTGGMNNCYCKSSMFARALGTGGYMDFEGAEFYKEAFKVKLSWGLGAGFGASLPFITCLWSIWVWWGMGELWSASERTTAHPLANLQLRPNAAWLK